MDCYVTHMKELMQYGMWRYLKKICQFSEKLTAWHGDTACHHGTGEAEPEAANAKACLKEEAEEAGRKTCILGELQS